MVNNAPGRRAEALAWFYDRHRDNPLIIDKWFGVQATSIQPDTFAQVVALRSHPDYSASNPNRLRSLIGAFGVNQVRFNAANGEGYRLMADEIIAIGRTNPGAAARLATPLTRWRRFDPGRRALIRGELERILAEPGLSRDVFEIASKSLSG